MELILMNTTKPFCKNRRQDEKRKLDAKKINRRKKLANSIYELDEIQDGKLNKDFYSCQCSLCRAEQYYKRKERNKKIKEEFLFKEDSSIDELEYDLELCHYLWK